MNFVPEVVQLINIGSNNGLVPNRRQAIIWTNDSLFYWRIYASLGLNELIQYVLGMQVEIVIAQPFAYIEKT